jgi:threonyl-tRNA synthetase
VAQLLQKFQASGIRAEADFSNEKITYKIREQSLQKVPVILAIGDKEIENQTATMRRFGSTRQITLSISEIIDQLQEEIRTKKLPDQLN